MPGSGEITDVNVALRADPSLAYSDPLATGWFFKVKLSEPAQLDALLDAATYDKFAAES
jgi:glycine cleavage system H protein